jgi:2'-5' RNA ligase
VDQADGRGVTTGAHGIAPANSARPAPLLVTADLPPDVLAWADGLRRAHFPPERNRLAAHVTLFHALPPSVDAELRRLLGQLAAGSPPPAARITGLMKLGRGTALAIDSPGMVALHSLIQQRMHGLMTPQDAQPLRLHITIQNKVSPQEAKALQAALGPVLDHRQFRFRGFGLFAYEDGLWRPLATYPFRG